MFLGRDSQSFIIPAYTLRKFLQKHELYRKLRKSTRNKAVNTYALYKWKSNAAKEAKYKLNIRYLPLVRPARGLGNTLIVLQNTKKLHSVARTNKKSLDYYVMVVFAGLYQPSKEAISETTWRVLKLFTDRFKVFTEDLCFDCEIDIDLGSKKAVLWFKNIIRDYLCKSGKLAQIGKSIYANSIAQIKDMPYKINKILLYDKYEKQKIYHKDKMIDGLENWKRVEIRYELNRKYWKYLDEDDGINKAISILDDIGRKMGVNKLFLDSTVLQKQMQKSSDLRKKVVFDQWARMK